MILKLTGPILLALGWLWAAGGSDCNFACGQSAPATPRASVQEAARLTVLGPADWCFRLNDTTYDLRGRRRELVTPPLTVGRTYVYDLVVLRGAEELARTSVDITAGQHLTLDLQHIVSRASNFGLEADKLVAPSGGQDLVTLNGVPIPAAHARELVAGTGPLPNYAGRRRLTIIGTAADRAAVLERVRGDLAGLVADWVVKDYAPDDWAVARVGFRTDGRPTIYAQEPDGQVLFRLDDAADLEHNLRALRRPRPDYRPELDPGRLDEMDPHSSLPPVLGLLALLLLLWALRRPAPAALPSLTQSRNQGKESRS